MSSVYEKLKCYVPIPVLDEYGLMQYEDIKNKLESIFTHSLWN